MWRDLLPHLPVFLAVARQGGFAAAAGELGMSPSAVSHAVRTVEDRLGAPLFARTTRSVALTEMGRKLNDSIGSALQEVQDALERARSERGQVTGLLRLNVPHVALPLAITPVVTELAWRHPELVVEVISDSTLTDIVAGGYDAGVRLGEMIERDMVAVRLTAPFKAIMVAAPAYLAAKGDVHSVADLNRHNCIGYRLVASGGIYAWELLDNGEDVSVRVTGTILVNDAMYAKELTLAGVGIAYLFEPLVRKEIREGSLRWVLPDAAITEPGLFLYFPQRAAEAPKLRTFIQVAREVLRPEAGK
ncbi:MAG: LysR family transcriptional regulator [Steroidobacteraceae bacterium]